MKNMKQTARTPSLSVLFICVGRRVELVRAFRRAGRALRVTLELHGADANPLAPAMYHVDRPHLVPTVDHRSFRGALMTLVRAERIDLLIPLSDVELAVVAELAPKMIATGCLPLISSPQVVNICRDKLKTFDALSKAGIDTPDTRPWREVLKRKRHRFPYYMKPRFGSAAIGNYVIHTKAELESLGRRVREPIVQEFVEGTEHTLDVYTGFDGKPRCVVPRRRLEVRAGEVSKGLIVKDRAIMAVGQRVAEVLGDCRGVVTVQCMVTADKRIRVIEINPRFGGGAPLAIHAGADFPRWILSERLGRRPRIRAAGFRDDIAMLRFDDSVFVPRASKRINAGTVNISTPRVRRITGTIRSSIRKKGSTKKGKKST